MLSPKPTDSPSQKLSLRLQGHDLIPLPEGALWWPAMKTLIVSDLHLEKGVSYARGGQYLPPYDTQSTLDRVVRLIGLLQPTRLISLGDSFHTPTSASNLDTASQAIIRGLTGQLEWVWIEGNHDPDPPAHLGGMCLREFRIGRLVFRHEPRGEAGEVAGHLHPCARVAGRGGKAVRRRCFVTNGEALVMPAMGAFTGGLNVLDPAYAPVLGVRRQAFMMGTDRVYAVSPDRMIPDRTKGPVWRF